MLSLFFLKNIRTDRKQYAYNMNCVKNQIKFDLFYGFAEQ
jgi:hypothetical protein